MSDTIATMSDQQLIGRAVQRAVECMARDLLAVDFAGTRDRLQLVRHNTDPDLTPEQVKEVCRTVAHRQLTTLAEAAYEPGKGLHRVGSVLAAAHNFYRATGMAYRQLEHIQRSTGTDRVAPIMRNESALGSLNLWLTPTISGNSGALGPDSMIGTDRDALRDTTATYFDTGVRCPWFEKMLLEALVAAETYATIQEVKSNATLTYGQTTGLWRNFLWIWIYQKTCGKSPMYELSIWAANFLTNTIGVIALAAFAWYSADKLDSDKALWGYLGLIACGWVALNWVGRFITRRVVGWASSPTSLSTHGTARTLLEMDGACRVVTNPAMSLHAARDTLLRCNANNVAFDQVALGLVERAISDGDIMWFRRKWFGGYGDSSLHDLFAEDDNDGGAGWDAD